MLSLEVCYRGHFFPYSHGRRKGFPIVYPASALPGGETAVCTAPTFSKEARGRNRPIPPPRAWVKSFRQCSSPPKRGGALFDSQWRRQVFYRQRFGSIAAPGGHVALLVGNCRMTAFVRGEIPASTTEPPLTAFIRIAIDAFAGARREMTRWFPSPSISSDGSTDFQTACAHDHPNRGRSSAWKKSSEHCTRSRSSWKPSSRWRPEVGGPPRRPIETW